MLLRNRRIAAACAALLVLGAACAPDDDGSAESDDEQTETSETETDSSSDLTATGEFGDLGVLCQDGDGVEINPEENGGDVLKIAVANDRVSDVRTNLNAILWHTATAFAGWCNEQGGLMGTKIELVDTDGHVVKVVDGMQKACDEAFAMVGGGYAQDQLEFPLFHECKMVDIAGFAVSPEKSDADYTVQPVPNPPYERTSQFFVDLPKVVPDAFEKTVMVFGDLPSIRDNKDQTKLSAAEFDGWGFVDDVSYNAVADNDWTQIAQKVASSKATAVGFVGEVENFGKFLPALRIADFDGPVFADINQYDPALIEAAGVDAEGVYLRSAFRPLDEADVHEPTAQFKAIFEKYAPGEAISGLAFNAFSAWLLFAKSFNECAESAPVTRDCIYEKAKAVTEWTGGGFHAQANPGENLPSGCSIVVTVKDGEFTRAYPEIDSADDDGDGFSCGDPGYVTIEGNFGKGAKRDG